MSNSDVVQPVTDALKAGYRLIDTAQVTPSHSTVADLL